MPEAPSPADQDPADRDPALVPGPTAAQWDLFAKLALAGSVFAVAIGVLAVALGAPPTAGFAFAVLIVVVAFFVLWVSLSRRALTAIRAEQAAGYSTVLDVAGYALRHPVTGALERAKDEAPGEQSRPRRSLVAGLLRPRPGSPLDKQLGD